jgi:hypothetical protein
MKAPTRLHRAGFLFGALELVTAGFRALSVKYHPDKGRRVACTGPSSTTPTIQAGTATGAFTDSGGSKTAGGPGLNRNAMLQWAEETAQEHIASMEAYNPDDPGPVLLYAQ